MRYLTLILFLLVFACGESQPIVEIDEEKWQTRSVQLQPRDSLESGTSYLSVYSQVYSFTAQQKYNLTGMISLRNVSEQDTVYLTRAAYFNTEGQPIRTYFDYPIYLRPLETLEIIIDQDDIEGGTGSNFIFDWITPKGSPEPLFEGLMNSMEGTQGMSFTTQAIRIK